MANWFCKAVLILLYPTVICTVFCSYLSTVLTNRHEYFRSNIPNLPKLQPFHQSFPNALNSCQGNSIYIEPTHKFRQKYFAIAMAMNMANVCGLINTEGIWMKNLQESSTQQDELEVNKLHCTSSTGLVEIKT